MKKKKVIITIGIIIIISILLIIGITLLIKQNNLKNDNKEENKISEVGDQTQNISPPTDVEYIKSSQGPSFYCSSNPNQTKTYGYDKGAYIYCEIAYELKAGNKGITEIWTKISYDEDIEFIETTEVFPEWKLSEKDNQIHLTTNNPSTYGDGLYKIKFRIKPSTNKEKMNISFTNIKYKDSENKYYQTEDSIIEIFINMQTNYKFETSENYDEITFYKFDHSSGYKQISKYECEEETCHVYAGQCTSYADLENGIILLLDGKNAVLYDMNKGILGKYYHEIYMLTNKEETKYFVVKDPNSEKYGIVNTSGKIIKEYVYENFGTKQVCDINPNTYSIESDIITAKKDNKYGIIKISKDETVIEYQYDDIRLYNDKYFKAKTENKWYLYNLNTKEKVHETGYKELFIVTDNIIITQIDNYLYFKDYQGNNIIEDKIEVFLDYNENACCGTPTGTYAYFDEETNKIKIVISTKPDSENNFDTYYYEFDINTKKLTKKDSTN